MRIIRGDKKKLQFLLVTITMNDELHQVIKQDKKINKKSVFENDIKKSTRKLIRKASLNVITNKRFTHSNRKENLKPFLLNMWQLPAALLINKFIFSSLCLYPSAVCRQPVFVLVFFCRRPLCWRAERDLFAPMPADMTPLDQPKGVHAPTSLKMYK